MSLRRAAIVPFVLILGTSLSLVAPAGAQSRTRARAPAAVRSPVVAPTRAPDAPPVRAPDAGGRIQAPAHLEPAVVRERVRQAIESGARDAAVGRRLRERLAERVSPGRELAGLDEAQREVVIEASRAAREVLARARAAALELDGRFDRIALEDPTIVRADAGHGDEFEELRALRQVARAELDAIALRVLAVLTQEQIAGFEARLAARGLDPTNDRVLHRIGLLLLMPDTIRVLSGGRAAATDGGQDGAIRTRRAPDRMPRSLHAR